MLVHILGGTGTVHVAKQGHAYWLELYMSQDTLVHILTGTVHVAKQGHASWNCTCRKNEIRFLGQFIENNFLQVNAVLQSNSDDVQVGSNVVVVVGSVVTGGKNLKPGI